MHGRDEVFSALVSQHPENKVGQLMNSKAIQDVINERKRQIGIGYTLEHDDDHDPGEISGAGAAYALHAACKLHPIGDSFDIVAVPPGWCWDENSFSPSSLPRTNLVMAAALLIAEIEKIDRAESKSAQSPAAEAK